MRMILKKKASTSMKVKPSENGEKEWRISLEGIPSIGGLQKTAYNKTRHIP